MNTKVNRLLVNIFVITLSILFAVEKSNATCEVCIVVSGVRTCYDIDGHCGFWLAAGALEKWAERSEDCTITCRDCIRPRISNWLLNWDKSSDTYTLFRDGDHHKIAPDKLINILEKYSIIARKSNKPEKDVIRTFSDEIKAFIKSGDRKVSLARIKKWSKEENIPIKEDTKNK